MTAGSRFYTMLCNQRALILEYGKNRSVETNKRPVAQVYGTFINASLSVTQQRELIPRLIKTRSHTAIAIAKAISLKTDALHLHKTIHIAISQVIVIAFAVC